MTPAPFGGVLLDASAIAEHLRLLGKDPLSVRVRAFAHKDNPRKPQIKARKGIGIHLPELAQWQAEERGLYLVINDGGDTKASITRCLAF